MAHVDPLQRGGQQFPIVRWALAGLVIASGLALAAPGDDASTPRSLEAACAGSAVAVLDPQLALPPGHPPIWRLQPQPGGLQGLPPGHPPIRGLTRGPGLQPPQGGALFAGPQTIDL